MPNAIISGTGFFVPPRVVTNLEMTTLYDTSDEWIRERSGIGERRWVEEGTGPSDLAVPALEMALADAGKMITSTVNTEITIPADATVAFPIGTRIDIGRLASAISFRAATGVTINGTSFQSMDSVSYQHGLLVKTAANTWVFLRFFA